MVISRMYLKAIRFTAKLLRLEATLRAIASFCIFLVIRTNCCQIYLLSAVSRIWLYNARLAFLALEACLWIESLAKHCLRRNLPPRSRKKTSEVEC